MIGELFSEGGPHKIKRLGNSLYSMHITIPKDEDGRIARECPDAYCSPGYFKVKPGTGITDGQEVAYCPYCRHCAEPLDFKTKEQMRYAKELVTSEAHKSIDGMFRDALGGLSYKPGTIPAVRRPFEDEVRRDVICPHCTLDQTVFGLATWCADCGQDIFMVHVSAELAVTRLMVGDVARRQETLGKRVAAKDLENCLEDAVSIFEASIKAIVRRGLIERGESQEQIDAHFKKIGNSFQSIQKTKALLKGLFDFYLSSDAMWDSLSLSFEKRHPVTHTLGVIDRKYLEKTQVDEREGREVRIVAPEIQNILDNVQEAIAYIYKGLILRKQ